MAEPEVGRTTPCDDWGIAASPVGGLSGERRHPEIEEVGAASGPATAGGTARRQDDGGATLGEGGRRTTGGNEGAVGPQEKDEVGVAHCPYHMTRCAIGDPL
jgi:hypothetical protein